MSSISWSEQGGEMLKLISKFVLVVLALRERVAGAGDEGKDFQELFEQVSSCHYGDPNVTECIRGLVESARGSLARGLPALGVQPLEPLTVPHVRLRQHHGGRLQYDAWLSDVMIQGLTNYTLNKLDIYPKELRVSADVGLPRLQLRAGYVVLGQFQMLPLESTGRLAANFSSCSASLSAEGARVHRRVLVRDLRVALRCAGAARAQLQDSHSVSAEMEKITAHIAAEHASALAAAATPAVETALAMLLEDLANKLLLRVASE